MTSRTPLVASILSRLTASRSVEARLAIAEARRLRPDDLAQPPVVPPNPAALKLYAKIGRDDADHAGADASSGSAPRVQPSAGIVQAWSRAPLDRLGERAQSVMSSYARGTLGRREPKRIAGWRVASSLWVLGLVMATIVVSGAFVEIVYGQHAAALLTGASPGFALTAAIAFGLVLNGGAFIAAGWLHRSSPTIVRRGGTRVFCVTMILVASTAVVLGLVIGGFDQLNLSGVSGGGPGTGLVAAPDTRPLLSMAYFLVVLTISCAIAAGHLLLLQAYESRLSAATHQAHERAERGSVPIEHQIALAISLARAHLGAIEFCHAEGTRRVDSYNARFRQLCSTDAGALFDDVVYDARVPLWAADVAAFIEDLVAERDGTRQLRLIG